MIDRITEHSNPPRRPLPCDSPLCKNKGTRWFGATSVRICEDETCREYFSEMMNRENENDQD